MLKRYYILNSDALGKTFHFCLRVEIGNRNFHVAFLTEISLKNAELLATKLNESRNSWDFTFENGERKKD